MSSVSPPLTLLFVAGAAAGISLASRKGLRLILACCVVCEEDGAPTGAEGDGARLRKGLLDWRLSVGSLGESRRSAGVTKGVLLADVRRGLGGKLGMGWDNLKQGWGGGHARGRVVLFVKSAMFVDDDEAVRIAVRPL